MHGDGHNGKRKPDKIAVAISLPIDQLLIVWERNGEIQVHIYTVLPHCRFLDSGNFPIHNDYWAEHPIFTGYNFPKEFMLQHFTSIFITNQILIEGR